MPCAEPDSNVHISVLPPGVNPGSDLAQYIEGTQYYPIRRTILPTTNYLPGFVIPSIPKRKPPYYPSVPSTSPPATKQRKTVNSHKRIISKKPVTSFVSNNRNVIKTVKLNGFEAPAILPRPKANNNLQQFVDKNSMLGRTWMYGIVKVRLWNTQIVSVNVPQFYLVIEAIFHRLCVKYTTLHGLFWSRLYALYSKVHKIGRFCLMLL